MDLLPLLNNLISAPILCFLLGVVAVACRSDLDLPQPIPKALSLFLLFAIGFKGGVELNHTGLRWDVVTTLLAAVAMATVVPVYVFWLIKWKVGAANAAAIAATYGSISAVTFITAVAWLEKLGIDYSGHLIAAMALMESPAIVVGVLMLRLTSSKDRVTDVGDGRSATPWGEFLRDAFFNGAVFLLMGALVIGAVTGESGKKDLWPFVDGCFKGALSLFLLDMGIVAARRVADVRRAGAYLVGFALWLPLFNAGLGMGVAWLLGLGHGDALLFTVLAASASYIAVPAAMRIAVPEATPSIYIAMALAITFPFNIVVGIPLYFHLIQTIWGPLPS